MSHIETVPSSQRTWMTARQPGAGTSKKIHLRIQVPCDGQPEKRTPNRVCHYPSKHL
jgi:hypothetical protein